MLDVFVGSGADRYTRLAIVTLLWALVTAILVQVFVEGGRIWADRRRRSHEASTEGGAAARCVGHRLKPPCGYRCSGCGNLTRFDVVSNAAGRVPSDHFTVGGDLEVEEEEVLDSRVEDVTCRWCGASGAAIEEIE